MSCPSNILPNKVQAIETGEKRSVKFMLKKGIKYEGRIEGNDRVKKKWLFAQLVLRASGFRSAVHIYH